MKSQFLRCLIVSTSLMPTAVYADTIVMTPNQNMQNMQQGYSNNTVIRQPLFSDHSLAGIVASTISPQTTIIVPNNQTARTPEQEAEHQRLLGSVLPGKVLNNNTVINNAANKPVQNQSSATPNIVQPNMPLQPIAPDVTTTTTTAQ